MGNNTSAPKTSAPQPSITTPVSVTVAANFGPEDIPTCARNSVSPRLRITRLAERGIVQFMPVSCGGEFAEKLERYDEARPTIPTKSGPMAGSGYVWIAPMEEAQRHADPDGDIVEFRQSALIESPKILAHPPRNRRDGLQHADAVAKLPAWRSGRGRMSASPRRTCTTRDACVSRQMEIRQVS